IRPELHRTQAGPPASHAVRIDESWRLITFAGTSNSSINPMNAYAKRCRALNRFEFCFFSFQIIAGVILLVVLLGTLRALGSVPPEDPDHAYAAPSPGTYVLPVIKPAGDGEVVDSRNHSLRLRDLTHGRVTVMSFIYTRCAAARACP